MISERYKSKRVAIIGYGIEGESTFEYLKRLGVRPDIFDIRDKNSLLKTNPELVNTTVISGKDYLDNLSGYDVIFRSPGISPLIPQIVAAVKGGSLLTSQIEEFMELCPCKTIGVTGTKGKGTTSTLITEILRANGADVYLGGNIGTPALSFLDKLRHDSIVVLELSSFQLQTLKKSPNIAVLLNTTSEHLDYHKDTEEYRSSKANIISYQSANDVAIVNADYEVPLRLAENSLSKKLYFSKTKEVEGCFVGNDDEIILKYGEIDTILAHASEMQLRGRHNLENITAAALATSVAGVKPDIISSTIKDFKGLEHRLELVTEHNGIKYYDDSFSTVPETAIAAIESFDEPIVLIVGGSSKNSDYGELGKLLSEKRLRGLVLIGETAPEIRKSIHRADYVIVEGGKNMSEIVTIATNMAQGGDVVLLSPACASKDMFKNYKDRGNQFKEVVKSIF